MQRLTITHVTRWQKHRHLVGHGHLYQGRYKSFPIQADDHFYRVVRYVERNALRAGLVDCAEAWRWSSLWRRVHDSRGQRQLLGDWPLPVPRRWRQLVNAPQTEAELAALRRSVHRGRPFGTAPWVHATAAALGLESTLRPRPRGRPAKHQPKAVQT